ncbi:MAG: ribosome small subunit-dependent GTPase A, partial [Clostridia bacterium]|nr:ribosome small subunit-dependent GTPase A [Clostridia bacterium]
MKGRIYKGLGGLYEVRLEDGNTVSAKARGTFRRSGITPYVGDYIEVLTLDDGSSGIDEICERKNSLIRPPFANLDYLFVCVPTAKPEPAVTTVDKLISIAEHQSIEPIIVITKTDENSVRGDELADIYTKSGFRVFSVCSPSGEGVDAVRAFFTDELCGCTAAFAGASGVGKTTLMNALFPGLGLATGEISAKISRGKHTTRHVELYDLSELTDGVMNGFLADTPG